MKCEKAMLSLSDWKRRLLENQGISTPDGRPLYAYRLTEEQFGTLESTLRSELADQLKYSSLGFFSSSNPNFSLLFILYAAEWWRRRYDGARWTWEPIQSDLGITQDRWSATQRGECITRGLRGWNLKLSDTAGLRYIGSVAVQGGLPMQLLAIAKGNIGRILRRVLKLAAGGTDIHIIRGWIESLKDSLPKSYQSEEIYILLAEVIATVMALKNEAKLTKSTEAICQLDQHVPHWRERFPLPIEDDEAQGLIEQLILDVIEDQSKGLVYSLTVERLLECQEDEIWRLYSNVALPDIFSTKNIRMLFNIDEAYALPRTIEFVIELPDQQWSLSARRIAGHDSYRLERRPCEFLDKIATSEHRLSLRTPDGGSWSTILRKGESLEQELPWLFESTHGSTPRLIRQGGGSVQTAEALVAIPSEWKVESGASCSLKAFIEIPEREVYVIKGDAFISDRMGRRWAIRTGQADATEESFQWCGDRVWLEFIRPSIAFRGRPSLCLLYGNEGRHQVPDRSLLWRCSSDDIGPVTVSYEEKGELRHQAQIVLLPQEATVEYQPIDASRGFIHLRYWKLASANLATGAEAEILLNHEVDHLSLECTALLPIAPEWLDLELSWELNPKPARIRLPFPAEGARVFDAKGNVLVKDSWLSVQRLTGVRLVSFCRSHTPMELCLHLRHTKEQGNTHDIRHRIRSNPGASRLDIRLQDYVDDILQLLASDELLDAWVEVILTINNLAAFSVRISRYDCLLKRLVSQVLVTNQYLKNIDHDSFESIPVKALRLEHPAEEAISLDCINSQGVATGAWDFAPEKREPGAWLIYPGPDSTLAFRPTLWSVPGESAASTPLTNTLAIENRKERAVAMDKIIASMTMDYCDPSWADLVRLANQLGHLPLATLDIWRQFAHSTAGMAALALHMGGLPNDFLKRFSLEQPFTWELVPLSAWLDAMRQCKRQSIAWFSEELAKQPLNDFLSRRVDELTKHNPSLGKLLGIVKSIGLEDNSKEIRMIRDPSSDGMFQQQLFIGEDCTLQRLFRDHADDTWPPSNSDLFYWIDGARRDRATAHLFPSEHFNFKDGIIGLPILLAIQVSTNSTGEWLRYPERIHTLRTYKAFDPDWFTEAFDLTIARCLSSDLMQLKELDNEPA